MELDFSDKIKELDLAKKQNLGGKSDSKPEGKCECEGKCTCGCKAKAKEDDDAEAAKAPPEGVKKEEDGESKKEKEAGKDDGFDKMKKAKASFVEKIVTSLEKLTKVHNEKFDRQVTLAQLKQAFVRGAKTYDTTHRLGKTRNEWAFARVNSFLKLMAGVKVKEAYSLADQDLVDESFASSSFEFIEFDDIEFQLAKIALLQAGAKESELNLSVEL